MDYLRKKAVQILKDDIANGERETYSECDVKKVIEWLRNQQTARHSAESFDGMN